MELITIDIPTKEVLEENLKKANKLLKEIDKLYEKLNNCKDDEEYEIYENKITESTNQLDNLYFMYLIVDKLNEIFPDTKKDYQYDVKYIYINSNTDQLMKEYDEKLLRLTKPDYSEDFYKKEIGWLYLFSGFTLKEVIEDNKVAFNQEKILRKRD